ncbi:MAG: MarR family winged helix-turn-helix transcriptional regulator, partial [Erysipelotrichaceae bacterium]
LLNKLEKQDISLKEVSNMLKRAPSTCTQVIDSLVDRDLVERKNDPNDRRSFILKITKHGKLELQALLEKINKKFEEIFAILSPDEKDNFKNIINKLNQRMQDEVLK